MNKKLIMSVAVSLLAVCSSKPVKEGPAAVDDRVRQPRLHRAVNTDSGATIAVTTSMLLSTC